MQLRQRLILKGHSLGVNAVAFSPDGRRVAFASADWTVKLWETVGGQEILCLRGYNDGVISLAFSPAVPMALDQALVEAFANQATGTAGCAEEKQPSAETGV